MNNIKKILIVLIILLIIVVTAIISIKVSSGQKESYPDSKDNNISIIGNDASISEEDFLPGVTEERKTASEVTLLTDKNKFFSIQKILTRYFLYLRVGNAEAVYNILEKQYINDLAINKENILDIMRANIQQYDGTYSVKTIYVIQDNYKPIYFIEGTLEKDLNKTSCYLIMKQDISNAAYSLKPIAREDYIKYTTNNLKEQFENDIELTSYNQIINITMTDEEMAEEYMKSYVHNARCYPEEAYDELDEEYKKAKFGNYQNYLNYLNNRRQELESLDATSIKKREEFATEEEYSQYILGLQQKYMTKYYTHTFNNKKYYVCEDSYGNSYLFEIIDVMNYKVVLDFYTTDVPAFIEEYAKSSKEEKVSLNVKKILNAIKDKDYNYVYKQFNTSAMAKDFGNYNNFSTYISNIVIDNYVIKQNEYSENGELCTFTLDFLDNNVKKATLTITLTLGEQTEYEIYSIQFNKIK